MLIRVSTDAGCVPERFEFSQRAWRARRVARERARRVAMRTARRMRRGSVDGGRVVTVNSAVVGEGRRMQRWGAVVSMLAISDLGLAWMLLCCGVDHGWSWGRQPAESRSQSEWMANAPMRSDGQKGRFVVCNQPTDS